MNPFNRWHPVTILLTSLAFSCTNTPKKADEQVLMDTDMAFAQMAEQQGFGAAFIAYADSNAILLQNGRHPIKGYASIAQAYAHVPPYLVLAWHPVKAEIAQSGDLGYTFGEYELTRTDSTGIKSTGVYVTVWKKQGDGSWKYVVDAGAEGPKE